MVTHTGILPGETAWLEGAWQATVLGVIKEADMIQHVNNNKIQRRCYVNGCQGLERFKFCSLELDGIVFKYFLSGLVETADSSGWYSVGKAWHAVLLFHTSTLSTF